MVTEESAISLHKVENPTKRDKVALEIWETEQTYVRSLQLVNKYYLKPIRENGLLKEKAIETIFGNLEQILATNEELLIALTERLEIWGVNSNLGDVIKKLVPFMKIYSDYYCKYNAANDELKRQMARSSSLTAFLEKTKATTPEGLDLFSYLIMPIQRIPRYRLLLEELIKHTAEDHFDRANLALALTEVQELANLMNKNVGIMEKYEELRVIEKRLTGKRPRNLVIWGRFLVHEGELTKLCRKVPKRRYFFLFNDLLLYGEKMITDDIKIHREIRLTDGKVVNIPDTTKQKNALQVLSKEKSFLVWASSAEEKEEWVCKLKESEKTLMKFRRMGANEDQTDDETDTREFAPTWQNDDDSPFCPFCEAKFTQIRRKHHCRNCGSLACARCSENKMTLRVGKDKKQRVCFKCFDLLSEQDSNKTSSLSSSKMRISMFGKKKETDIKT